MIDPKKPTILTMDLGTYCDNKLAEIAFSEIVKHYNVVYITDNKHQLDPRVYTKVGFDTPAFFTNDPDIAAADPKRSLAGWMIRQPTQPAEMLLWSIRMRKLIAATIEEHNPVGVLIMYPALILTFLIDDAIKLPVYVVYVAPGVVNYSVPWVFDSNINKPDTPLYVESKSNKNSGLVNLTRAARIAEWFPSAKSAFARYASYHHICCWDPKALPKPRVYREKSMHVIYSKALLPEEVTKPPPMPRANATLRKCLRTYTGGIVFLSFGSYGKSAILREPLELLLSLLDQFCEAHRREKIGVIFHNGNAVKKFVSANKLQHISIVNGFIPYEALVPKCKLVIFTGSVCLQNICLYHATPMMFFPLLTEQFYWAKNYTYHTGIPYIDFKGWQTMLDKPTFFVTLQKAMQNQAYLTKVQRNMLRYGPRGAPKEILAIIQKGERSMKKQRAKQATGASGAAPAKTAKTATSGTTTILSPNRMASIAGGGARGRGGRGRGGRGRGGRGRGGRGR